MYRLIEDEPPPLGTKLILVSRNGIAVIGQYYAEGEFIAWCPLPRFTKEQKERLND